MLRLYPPSAEAPSAHPALLAAARLPPPEALSAARWIDLVDPTAAEIAAVEGALAVSLPTRADMEEIEASSRVYEENGVRVMNLLLPFGVDQGTPAVTPVSLVLTPRQFLTIRYAEPTAFRMLTGWVGQRDEVAEAPAILVRLLDSIVDRSADILEKMGDELDRISAHVFGLDQQEGDMLSTRELRSLLREIGRVQYILNKLYQSLVTQQRAVGFLASSEPASADPTTAESLQSLGHDIRSLTENGSYLIENMNFLLDAAVGRISVEQNVIVKIFTIAAVIFLPPTLIASIYGMNFHHMPELANSYGYPLALAAMLLTALVPLLWFRRKGWF